MANYKKSHFVQFGPAIPIVPIGDFSKMRMSRDQMADAWSIIGPSAQQNMSRNFKGQCLELWQVIAAAYLEGLHHGSELEKEKRQCIPQPSNI